MFTCGEEIETGGRKFVGMNLGCNSVEDGSSMATFLEELVEFAEIEAVL